MKIFIILVYIFARIIQDFFDLWITEDYRLLKNYSKWYLWLLAACVLFAVADFIDDSSKLSFSMKKIIGVLGLVVVFGIGIVEIIKTKDKEEKKDGTIFLILILALVIASDEILKLIELF